MGQFGAQTNTIRHPAASPFKGGDGFQTQVLTNCRTPLEVEIGRLNLTPFPDPLLQTDAGPCWDAAEVDTWMTANKGL